MHDGGGKYNAVAGLFNFVLNANAVKVTFLSLILLF